MSPLSSPGRRRVWAFGEHKLLGFTLENTVDKNGFISLIVLSIAGKFMLSVFMNISIVAIIEKKLPAHCLLPAYPTWHVLTTRALSRHVCVMSTFCEGLFKFNHGFYIKQSV